MDAPPQWNVCMTSLWQGAGVRSQTDRYACMEGYDMDGSRWFGELLRRETAPLYRPKIVRTKKAKKECSRGTDKNMLKKQLINTRGMFRKHTSLRLELFVRRWPVSLPSRRYTFFECGYSPNELGK